MLNNTLKTWLAIQTSLKASINAQYTIQSCQSFTIIIKFICQPFTRKFYLHLTTIKDIFLSVSDTNSLCRSPTLFPITVLFHGNIKQTSPRDFCPRLHKTQQLLVANHSCSNSSRRIHLVDRIFFFFLRWRRKSSVLPSKSRP